MNGLDAATPAPELVDLALLVGAVKPWPRAKARREWTMRLRPFLA